MSGKTGWWQWLRDRLPRGGHALVAQHFKGTAALADERRLWRHLGRCDSCRGRYRAWSLLEALETDGLERARRRIGRAVFAPRRPVAAVWGLGAAMAVAVALLVFAPRGLYDRGFRARGLDTPAVEPAGGPGLVVYRIAASGGPAPAERVGAVIRGGDGLAFSYLNPPAVGASHLMVFAVDGTGRVYWFWPEWRSTTDNPGAVPITASASPVELPEGVRHQLPAGSLTLYALFARRSYDVRQVEATVAAGEAALRGLDGSLWSERLEVAP